MERGRTISMLRQPPAGAVVREEVHVKNTLATAGTDHRGLFLESIFLHNIERASPEPVREGFLNNHGLIRGNQPVVEPVTCIPE